MWECSINKKTGRAVWNGIDRDNPAAEAAFYQVAAADPVTIVKSARKPKAKTKTEEEDPS